MAAGAAERKETASEQLAEAILKHLRSDPAFLGAANGEETRFQRGLSWEHKLQIPASELSGIGGVEEFGGIWRKAALNVGECLKESRNDLQLNPTDDYEALKNPRMKWFYEVAVEACGKLEEKLFGQLQSSNMDVDWSQKDMGTGKGSLSLISMLFRISRVWALELPSVSPMTEA
ncbi:hypothetical protein HZA42_05875 [Candidatus Peregrinibacteria bacterium]|nr:hypothetical protein [Candidatus Peregrinibacteria bacterium]